VTTSVLLLFVTLFHCFFHLLTPTLVTRSARCRIWTERRRASYFCRRVKSWVQERRIARGWVKKFRYG
jgi:hypothetical protein